METLSLFPETLVDLPVEANDPHMDQRIDQRMDQHRKVPDIQVPGIQVPGIKDPHMRIALQLAEVLKERASRDKAIRRGSQNASSYLKMDPLADSYEDKFPGGHADHSNQNQIGQSNSTRGVQDNVRKFRNDASAKNSSVIAHAICDHLLASLREVQADLQNDQDILATSHRRAANH